MIIDSCLAIRASEPNTNVDSWSRYLAAQAFAEIHNTENPTYVTGIWADRGLLKRSTSDLF